MRSRKSSATPPLTANIRVVFEGAAWSQLHVGGAPNPDCPTGVSGVPTARLETAMSERPLADIERDLSAAYAALERGEWQEAENRLHAQNAIILTLIGQPS